MKPKVMKLLKAINEWRVVIGVSLLLIVVGVGLVDDQLNGHKIPSVRINDGGLGRIRFIADCRCANPRHARLSHEELRKRVDERLDRTVRQYLAVHRLAGSVKTEGRHNDYPYGEECAGVVSRLVTLTYR